MSEIFSDTFHHKVGVISKGIPHSTCLWEGFPKWYIWGCSVAQLLSYRKCQKMIPFYCKMLNSAVSAEDTQLAEIKVAFQSGIIMKQLLGKNFDEILFTFCSIPLVYIYSWGVKTICSSRNFSNFANLSSFPIPRLSFKPLRINETLLKELLEHVNKNNQLFHSAPWRPTLWNKSEPDWEV